MSDRLTLLRPDDCIFIFAMVLRYPKPWPM